MRHYLCIDLKSFYASVECVERGLDPMTTDLVVADPERTKGTICLAVSPSLKEKGIKNRCRLFEIPDYTLKSTIIAPPRMQKYIDYAAKIYGVYLQYISKEDIHVYSIDEAFLDVTDYLKLYQKNAKQMAEFLMQEVLEKVGVRATAGVGTNLYLAKIALDITAKHAKDFIGVLDEKSYQKNLWNHQPLTDFWRIGPGIAKRLNDHGIHTMGELAHADEEIIYRIFGKNAELLIDHAWGKEPVTIKDIKTASAREKSFSMGQVLPKEYSYSDTMLAIHEMTRALCLRLIKEHQLASSLSLILGYSYSKSMEGLAARSFSNLPHGTIKFDQPTNSSKIASKKVEILYHKIANKKNKYRRIYINFNHLIPDNSLIQTSLFSKNNDQKDQKVQSAIIDIQNRYGKTAIMRGEDLENGSTFLTRSKLIGGHSSGKTENRPKVGKNSRKNKGGVKNGK